jgi:hypothetical protein
LEFDNGLGAGQALCQAGIVALQAEHFVGERVGLRRFGAAPGWFEGREGAGVPLTTPIGQR